MKQTLLMNCIINNNLDQLPKYLNELKQTTESGITSLMLAAQHNRIKMIPQLISELGMLNSESQSATIIACQQGNYRFLSSLVAEVRNRNCAELNECLYRDVSAVDMNGNNVVYHVGSSGCVDVMKELVKNKSLLSSLNNDGQTILITITINQCKRVSEIRQKMKSTLDQSELLSNQSQKLFITIQSSLACINLIRDQCGKRDRFGQCALHYASKSGFPELVELLLSEINIVDNDGNTALMYAAINQQHNNIQHLIPLLRKQNNQGKTALMLMFSEAEENITPEIFAKHHLVTISMLEQERGMCDASGNTALMNACNLLFVNKDAMNLLIQAELGMKNSSGQTALMKSLPEYVQYLTKEIGIVDNYNLNALFHHIVNDSMFEHKLNHQQGINSLNVKLSHLVPLLKESKNMIDIAEMNRCALELLLIRTKDQLEKKRSRGNFCELMFDEGSKHFLSLLIQQEIDLINREQQPLLAILPLSIIKLLPRCIQAVVVIKCQDAYQFQKFEQMDEPIKKKIKNTLFDSGISMNILFGANIDEVFKRENNRPVQQFCKFNVEENENTVDEENSEVD